MRGWMMIFGGIGIPGTALSFTDMLTPGMFGLCILFLSLFLIAVAINLMRGQAS